MPIQISAPDLGAVVVPIQVNLSRPPRRRPKYELRELRDPASGEVVWVSAGAKSRESRDEKRAASEGCSAWWREQIRAKRHKQRPLKAAYSRLIRCHDGLKYPPIYTADHITRRGQRVIVSHDFVTEQTELLRMKLGLDFRSGSRHEAS